MKIKDAIKMVKEIVTEVDYDIAKGLDKETAEEPEEVDKKIKDLLSIIKNYIPLEK